MKPFEEFQNGHILNISAINKDEILKELKLYIDENASIDPNTIYILNQLDINRLDELFTQVDNLSNLDGATMLTNQEIDNIIYS